MTTRWLLAACLPALLYAQDPKEIVRRAVKADLRNDEIARNYTYLQRQEQRTLDGSGRVKDTKIETWDITLLDGSPYRRLVSRDDKALPADDERKEEEKLRKSIDDRKKETESQRQKRLAEWDKRRQKSRDQYREVANAFNFRMAGEEHMNGADAWVIEGTPRPGFRASTSEGRALLPKVNCRLWIAKSDYSWVRVEVETLDTISLAFSMVRLAKGGRIVVDLTRVNDEVWLPKQATVKAGARILLVKSVRLEAQFDYRDYKKFQADSSITYQDPK